MGYDFTIWLHWRLHNAFGIIVVSKLSQISILKLMIASMSGYRVTWLLGPVLLQLYSIWSKLTRQKIEESQGKRKNPFFQEKWVKQCFQQGKKKIYRWFGAQSKVFFYRMLEVLKYCSFYYFVYRLLKANNGQVIALKYWLKVCDILMKSSSKI